MSQSGNFLRTSGPGAVVQTLTGNTGGPVGPTGGNINIIGGGNITVTGFPGLSDLTITEVSPSALEFDAQSGSAFPNGLGVINIVGSGAATTSASGNTITISVPSTAAETFDTNSGTATPSAGVINIFGIGGLTTTGSGNTVTIDGSGITGIKTIDGDVGSVTGTTVTITGGTSGAVFTGVGATLTESFNFLLLPTTTVGGNGVISFGAGNRTIHAAHATSNIFVGFNAGNLTLTGVQSTAMGASALAALTSGNDNTAVGFEALFAETTGVGNTAVGANALVAANGSSDNVCVGFDALSSLVTGIENTAIGYLAGSNLTTNESYNIYLGTRVAGTAAESNVIRIGSTSGGSAIAKTFVAGINGVNVGSTATVVTESGNQLGTAVITAGANITVTPGANTITIAANSSSVVYNYTSVNHAASPYTVLSTDYYISADVTAGVITILLPNAPTTGRSFVIKDKVGLAGTSNITVTTVGGVVTIDGGTSFVMNTAYEAISLIFNGSNYEIF